MTSQTDTLKPSALSLAKLLIRQKPENTSMTSCLTLKAKHMYSCTYLCIPDDKIYPSTVLHTIMCTCYHQPKAVRESVCLVSGTLLRSFKLPGMPESSSASAEKASQGCTDFTYDFRNASMKHLHGWLQDVASSKHLSHRTHTFFRKYTMYQHVIVIMHA